MMKYTAMTIVVGYPTKKPEIMISLLEGLIKAEKRKLLDEGYLCYTGGASIQVIEKKEIEGSKGDEFYE